ncbi:T9SS type A sorting domain-containing protein [Arsenicibacter rosenii]|uniref:Secretion system C-terminal sorting domain-containing protein n=1 Tax=Arsenicibacter rosenii TaxID=1750698 RepID=A0A1S2VMH2_9BACT|nr:T9SS type A sorting domain-containing protein [Arsenicibacter rosenii]OIN59959.1 hypothetical protein BLX24_08980 [Arsenicibacter rosenii]
MLVICATRFCFLWSAFLLTLSFCRLAAQSAPAGSPVITVQPESRVMWTGIPVALSVGAARMATDVSGEEIQLIPLGNPTTKGDIEVELQAAGTGILHLQVLNTQGQLISEQGITHPTERQRVRVSPGKATGVYFLKAITPTRTKTIKVFSY